MPTPTNTTRLTAELITLPHSGTQNVTDSGTTYEVWYKFVADTDGVVKFYGSGGRTTGYQPWIDIFENASTDIYNNFQQNWSSINCPVYVPVTAGNTYYLNFYMVGLPFVATAVLTLSVAYVPSFNIQPGDFITNMEVDSDAEGPICVLRGNASQQVRQYKQVAAPAETRGQDGLPHGPTGSVFVNGNCWWIDDQYGNLKIYDSTLTHVITLDDFDGEIPIGGVSRAADHIWTYHRFGGTSYLRAFDDAGTMVREVSTATDLGSLDQCGVNEAESIFYYNPGGTTTIKRWDLDGNTAMADLVSDTAGYRLEDLLVLEDDTILVVWHEETGPPYDVKVKHYDTAGLVLQTFEFGDFWRSSLNPPRIGFALEPDNNSHFWIALKPQGQNEVSLIKKVKISDGSYATELEHVNYLSGTYLGIDNALMISSSNGTQDLVTNNGIEIDIEVVGLAVAAFADGSGTQPQLQFGTDSDPDLYAQVADFVDAPAGSGFNFPGTLPAGADFRRTALAATGTGTGSLRYGLYRPDTLGPLGSEKAYALMLARVAVEPEPPDHDQNGPDGVSDANTTVVQLVRLRRSPHLADENQFVFYSQFVLDVQAGVGTESGQGYIPTLRLRWSDDGGSTWSNGQQMGVGKMGAYQFRCIARRLGRARVRTWEVTQSDPVESVWISAYLELEEGEP